MSYVVLILRPAERQLERLPKEVIVRFLDQVGRLAEDPRPHGSQKLRGSHDIYRIRVGSYRAIYRVDDATQRVFVHTIGHRKDVYRRS